MALVPSLARLQVFVLLLGLLLLTCDSAPEYDPVEAALYLQYARASFCDQDAIRQWDCGDMCEDAAVVPGSVRTFGPGSQCGVQGFVALLPGGASRCITSFRGTVNALNWQTDADILLTEWPPPKAEAFPCPGCKVHAGFALAYQELREEVWQMTKQLACSSVDITGHSLGAAVATLASMDLRGSGVQVDAFWSFGSPRVGNAEFVASFIDAAARQGVQTPSWRVVHYHDPVPQGGPSDSFTHVPGEVYYKRRESDDVDVCRWTAQEPENTSCGSRTLSNLDVIDGLTAGDHVHYLNKTLQIKFMSEKCISTNSCRKRGFVSQAHLVFVSTVVGLAACGAGGLTVLAWQHWSRARAARRCRDARGVGISERLAESQVAMSRVA